MVHRNIEKLKYLQFYYLQVILAGALKVWRKHRQNNTASEQKLIELVSVSKKTL